MWRKLRALAAVLPLVLLIVPAGAGPAAAAPGVTTSAAPVVHNWDCDPGGSLIFCAIGVSDGVAPYSYTWYKDGVHRPQFTNQTIRIGCIPGNLVRIDVTVTDAVGQQVSAWALCTCVRDWV